MYESLVFLVFVALSICTILASGYMTVDSQLISYQLPLARYQIKWNEVNYIEIDKQGGNMVFVGENKRLAVNGPASWSGKSKAAMLALIYEQIQKHSIEIRQTQKAMFRLSKNTKIRV